MDAAAIIPANDDAAETRSCAIDAAAGTARHHAPNARVCIP